MEPKQELIREYKEWTVKYMEATERLKTLEQEFLKGVPLTQELVADFLQSEEDVKLALTNRQLIREQFYRI